MGKYDGLTENALFHPQREKKKSPDFACNVEEKIKRYAKRFDNYRDN